MKWTYGTFIYGWFNLAIGATCFFPNWAVAAPGDFSKSLISAWTPSFRFEYIQPTQATSESS